MRMLWLQQSSQEMSSNGTAVQILQENESLLKTLCGKTSAQPTTISGF